MRTKLIVAAFLVLCCTISFREGQKRRDFSAFGHSAEWGCYAGSSHACYVWTKSEEVKNQCLEEALEVCPKAGEAFKKFMEQGRKR